MIKSREPIQNLISTNVQTELKISAWNRIKKKKKTTFLKKTILSNLYKYIYS